MTSADRSVLRVGIVEDEARLRDLLVREITAMGHMASGFSTAEQAWLRICEGLDAVILDLNLPGMSGMELFRRIRSESCNTAVIILTGFGAFDSAVQSIRWKAEDYLTKPCSLAEIDRALARVLVRKQENEQLRTVQSAAEDSFGTLTTEEDAMPRLRANSDGNTLADMERQRIFDAMQKYAGNKPAVAAELGISLRTLYNRLNSYRHQGYLK